MRGRKNDFHSIGGVGYGGKTGQNPLSKRCVNPKKRRREAARTDSIPGGLDRGGGVFPFRLKLCRRSTCAHHGFLS